MTELRVVLRHCEKIDPADIDTYLARDGFKALEQVRGAMSPAAVIEIIKASGLRGRGGAGFPCGVKWEAAAVGSGSPKYVICNADEGEMGTFKDRYILAHDPYSYLEGLAIAAYAVGAQRAFIYLRDEYRYLTSAINRAIEQAVSRNLLPDLEITVQHGAGAYVCGEETALMNSLEGRRGEARYKPPFPPVKGLFGRPTIINNVETLAVIAQIIVHGADWFRAIGTAQSKGTKVFSVSGDVARPGVYELALGSSLKELVHDLAGADDPAIIQVGGAAGRILPASMLDTPLSFETVLGAGAVTVFNSRRDIIDVVAQSMAFLADESCGFCTPCREGTRVAVETLERLQQGDGAPEDARILEDLAKAMAAASMCGLGQGAAIPLLDSLNYFKTDYDNRIHQSLFIKSQIA